MRDWKEEGVRVREREGLEDRESVCCLLVLNSVTSTPQWIRQPEAARVVVVVEAKEGEEKEGVPKEPWKRKDLQLALHALACRLPAQSAIRSGTRYAKWAGPGALARTPTVAPVCVYY